MEVGEKGQGRAMEGFELIKVKYTHSGDSSKNPFSHKLRN
jgi:hypothetical protein